MSNYATPENLNTYSMVWMSREILFKKGQQTNQKHVNKAIIFSALVLLVLITSGCEVNTGSLDEQPSISTCLEKIEKIIFVEGGSFTLGAGACYLEELPPHHKTVSGFWMSQTEVTNQQFAEFIDATGYVTVAERQLHSEDFPGITKTRLGNFCIS